MLDFEWIMNSRTSIDLGKSVERFVSVSLLISDSILEYVNGDGKN